MKIPKVITLWQPWATLLAYGLKKNETRPKPTKYVGTYLIHAAKRFTYEQQEVCYEPYFLEALTEIGINSLKDLPLGYIVGAYDQVRCLNIYEKYGYSNQFHTDTLSQKERAFGDYSQGRWVWIGNNHRALQNPIPYKGGQGYYLDYKGDLSLISSLIS